MQDHGVVGRPLEECVAAVAEEEDAPSRQQVRETIDPVTEDGVITAAAIETAVSDTAKLVTTAETRVELAEHAYADASEAADPVDDLDRVQARLERYGQRLSRVRSRADALGEELAATGVEPETPAAVYETAARLREIASHAQGVVRTADDLSFDLEQFERWLDQPSRRYDETGDDLDLVAEWLTDLEAAVEALPGDSPTPAADWADAKMRARVAALLLTDLRAEARDLRTWADRRDISYDETIDRRLERMGERVSDLETSLERWSEPAWHDRFGDALAAFDDALDAFDPPVEWGAVQEILETHRPEADDPDG